MVLSDCLTKSIQERIQKFRLYLQVILLSDICTPNGEKLDADYYKGKKRRMSKLYWTEQARPNETAREEWKKLMRRLI